MTLADGHSALHHTSSPPLAPAAEQEAIGIAVDTSAIASTLLLLRQAEQDTRRHAWPRRRQSPTVRRARSLSPSRRSPKLRHTNGRLHADSEDGGDAEGGVDGDGECKMDENELMLAEQEAELLLLRDLALADPMTQRRPRHESHSFPSSAAVDLASFPARNDVRRSISCVDNPKRRAHAHANDDDAASGSASDEQKPVRTPRRFKIFYRDEALRESCAKNTRRVIENAKRLHAQPTAAAADPSGGSSPDSADTAAPLSNQQRVTLKLLKYRNLIDRVHEIDESRLNDPSFDVLECLGAEWCKV